MDYEKNINKISEVLAKHEKRIQRLEDLFGKKRQDIVKKTISIKEFVISRQPTNEIQVTLAIAYYLEKYDGMQFYNVKDLENGFRKAKERVPRNLNYKVFKNAEKGYLMEAEEKKDGLKAWTLTNTGEAYVQNNFT